MSLVAAAVAGGALSARMLADVVGRHEHVHEPHPLHGHVDVGWLSLGGHVHLHGVAGSGAFGIGVG